MLRKVFFLTAKKNLEDEETFKAIKDTGEYILDNGYDCAVFTSEKDLREEITESEKGSTLIITSMPDKAKKLLSDGYYVVGMQDRKSKDLQFPGVKYIFGEIDQVDMDSFVKAYQRYSGEPWEILRTERLIIRETTLEDVDEFYKVYADPSMTLYMEGLFEDPEDEKRYQKDYIEKVYGLMGFGVWTLVRKEDNAIIGRAGYSVRNGFDEIELGFLVGVPYQRQGYCMEACRAILDYGRDVLQLNSVQTLVKEENKVSIHICEKLGFEKAAQVDVEENIYGKEYNEGQRVALSQSKYGRYLRMLLHF